MDFFKVFQNVDLPSLRYELPLKGSSVYDVTQDEGEVVVTYVTLSTVFSGWQRGEGGSENLQICLTLFMDDPL